MITIIYVLLHILILAFCYFYCQKAKIKKSYLYFCLLPILAFVIVYGLRWGRNIDWCVYYRVYERMKIDGISYHEPIFSLIWKSAAMLELPYPILISVCSCLFISSVFYFCKPYKNALYLIIPLIIVTNASLTENLIRFYMAFSFALIALRLYLNKKYLVSSILLLCSSLTHFGIILLMPIYLLIGRLRSVFCTPKISIIVCSIIILVFSPEMMKHFTFVLDFFSLFEKFDQYQVDSVGWLTGKGQTAKAIDKSIFRYFISSIPYWIVLIKGYDVCKIKKELIPIYNLMLIGIFIRVPAAEIDLFYRYFSIFLPFYGIMTAFVLIYLKKTRQVELRLVLLAFICFWIYKNIAPLREEVFMHYIWDKQIDPNLIIMKY